MPTREEMAQGFLEQVIAARASFDKFDASFNDAVQRIMNAYAKLAEDKPEEMFGLKPSERDRFFADRLLAPAVLRAAGEPTRPVAEEDDVTGGNPLSVAAIADALAKIASSEGGAKIVEEFLHHLRAEKDFFKETGQDIIGGIKEFFG